MPVQFDATAYAEPGGWVIHAVDIGRQIRIDDKADAASAARQLYATVLARPIDEIRVDVRVYRTTLFGALRALTRQVRRNLS